MKKSQQCVKCVPRMVECVCAALLLSFTACKKETHTLLPIFDGSGSDVQFVFGDAEGAEQVAPVEFVEVVTCNADSAQGPSTNVMWRIESATTPNIVKVSRVGYGETPLGARVVVEAQPIVPGCYWVRDSHARYRFARHAGGWSGSGDFLATDPIFRKR